jgi:fimbrial chaperone protein
MSTSFHRVVSVFMFAMLAACGCGAAGLSISPLRLDFDAQRNISAITVTNTSSETVTFEAEALPWPREAPEQSPRDVIVNPPVATLAPGAQRTLRIGLVKRLGAEQERSYRVYITELAAPRATEANGLGVRLRLGVPVFVAAAVPHELPMQWSARSEGKLLSLTATNPGNVHQRVAGVSIEREGRIFVATQTSSYVLPGRSTVFQVDGLEARPGEHLELRVRIGDGVASVPVDLP